MARRRKLDFFARVPGSPPPVTFSLPRRAGFSEVDVMGIVWHGRYAQFFDEASSELRRRIGLSYQDFFDAGLEAPIVQLHVEYLHPLFLDDEFTVNASLIWNEGSRLDTEYRVVRKDGALAAAGYTVQVFTQTATGEVCLVAPPLLERVWRRWRAGEFAALQ